MKTLHDLEAEHAKARAKLEAELELAKLAPVAPDFVLPDKGGRRPSWITYRGRSLTQALELMAAFSDCVPFYRHKGTFCELVPDGTADPKAEIQDGPFACYLDVSEGAGFGPTAELVFFAGLNDPANPDQKRLVRVSVKIDGPDYIGAFSALKASRQPVKVWHGRREVTEWRVGPNGSASGLADGYVQWATGTRGQDSAHFSYLFQADTEAAGPMTDNEHALGQIRNLRDEFQPAAELIESTPRADYYRIPGAKGRADVFAAVAPGAPAPANSAGYYTLESLKSLKGDS